MGFPAHLCRLSITDWLEALHMLSPGNDLCSPCSHFLGRSMPSGHTKPRMCEECSPAGCLERERAGMRKSSHESTLMEDTWAQALRRTESRPEVSLSTLPYPQFCLPSVSCGWEENNPPFDKSSVGKSLTCHSALAIRLTYLKGVHLENKGTTGR